MTPQEYLILADKTLELRFEGWTKAQRLAYLLGFISTDIGDIRFSLIVENLIQKQGKKLAEFAEKGNK
jgi:hypothetical protein